MTAAIIYLDCMIRDGTAPAAARDTAYRCAHHPAADILATIDEPPPEGTRAAALLPQGLGLNHLIDEISALASPSGPGGASKIRTRLEEMAGAWTVHR